MAQVQHAPSYTAYSQVYPPSAPRVPDAHFNARGELIPYAIGSAFASLSVPTVAMPVNYDAADADLDDDTDLELAYPDDEVLQSAQSITPPVLLDLRSQMNPLSATISPVVQPLMPQPPPKPLPRRPRPRPGVATANIRSPPFYAAPASAPNIRSPSAMLPPPPPPRKPPPVYTPVMVPAAAPLPPAPPTEDSCPTPGCRGKAPAKGRRCLACVRSSWLDRGKMIAALEAKEERVTIKLKLSPKKVVILDPKEEEERKAKESMTGSAAKAGTEEAGKIDGWDSELSDLTDSDGETEVEETPQPSFKIRIPARSANPAAAAASPPADANSATSSTADPSVSIKPPTTPEPAPASSLPTPPASGSDAPRFCTISRCRAPLPPLSVYRWKCCSPCRKHCREYQRERHARRTAEAVEAAIAQASANGAGASLTPVPELKDYQREYKRRALAAHRDADRANSALSAQRAQEDWQREEKRRALAAPFNAGEAEREVAWSVPPGVWPQKQVSGARVCAGRVCGHIIPGPEEYEWKMCGVCRGRERRKAERGGARSSDEARTEQSEIALERADMPIAAEQKPGRCRYADCGVVLPEDAEVSVAECEQCLRRKMPRNYKLPGSRRRLPKPIAVAQRPQTVTGPEKPLEAPLKRKRTSPYPAYQGCDALLADFGSRFRAFIQAQSYYFLARSGRNGYPPQQESMFDFSGEYAVVSPDFDVVARKSSIQVGVHALKDAVARAGGLEFSPTSWVSILDSPGGVVTRFACVHLVNSILPIRMPAGYAPNPQGLKSMQGELEIAVLPDDSHKYFSGERTIVRFRLVG